MPETDESATDFVVGGDTRLTELREALAAIEAAYTENPDDADIGMELAHAYTDLADAGEHDAVPRAQALILGLGFKSHELDEPVNSFSGGWRMRLQLARALMCPSDLLLLDEPTNHLDLDALVWLEAWLQKYQGTMIVISHDREFLDAVTDVTLHIANAQLTRYGGNYSKFEDMRALQMEQQQVAFSKQQDKIAHLQKFIDRFKAKASKAKQAQSRVKALERMEQRRAAAGRGRLHLRVQGAGQHSRTRCCRSATRASATRSRTKSRKPSCAASAARCWRASASASWAPTARASRRW